MSTGVASGLFVALVVLAIMATFKTMTRASRGYDRARRKRVARGPQAPCPVCRSPMELMGIQEFRLGEAAMGVDKEAAAALGAVGQDLPLEVHRCPTCRKLELFLPPSAG